MKAQAFIMDLLFGMLITITALLSVVLFLPTPQAPFVHDAERMQVLMTEGVPANWTAATVIVPGFLTDNRFNTTKIAEFESMTSDEQRELLGIASDFSITFTTNGIDQGLCGACGETPATYSELLPVQRYGLLGSNITLMEVRLYR
jgi:hypothetical protein